MIPYGHQWIDKDDVDAVISVLQSDWLTTGPCIEQFEEALCAYTGSLHAVVVNSATSALDIAVQALEISPGSEVITTPFTFAATSNALLFNGLVPVYADIVRETRNINPDSIRERITDRTKAILFVDYAGHPCDIKEIREITEDHNLCLLEDAAHAFGSSYNGKKVGTFADVTIFSFHPVKPITTAEGGVAMTDDLEIAERMRLLRSHGIKKNLNPNVDLKTAWRYDMVMLGRNYRMTDLQAALGLSQLKKLDQFIRRRNELAGLYDRKLRKIPNLELPRTKPGNIHGWHLYTVLVKDVDRDSLFGYLRNWGVGVNVHYIPTYRLSYYQQHVPTDYSQCPVTEEVFRHIITLPLYPAMTEDDVSMIVETINKYELN